MAVVIKATQLRRNMRLALVDFSFMDDFLSPGDAASSSAAARPDSLTQTCRYYMFGFAAVSIARAVNAFWNGSRSIGVRLTGFRKEEYCDLNKQPKSASLKRIRKGENP
jgi:hypothetical protein